MPVPYFIARPLFPVLYRLNRRHAPIPPFRRVVRPLPAETRSAFDRLLDTALAQGPNSLIDFRLPYPKVDFMNYACDWRGYVAHGTPLPDLDVLEPLRLSHDSSEFGNRKQIFCSPDGAWAMWFAILDKSQIRVTRNGCVCLGKGPGRIKFYHFELPAANRDAPPFTDGMMYLAQAEDFPDHHPIPILERFCAEFEEWGSAGPVTPLARLPVTPQDFPYLDQVQYYL